MKIMTTDNKPEKNIAESKDLANKSNWDILLYLYILIRQNRKWWLLPFLAVLAFLSIFVGVSGNRAILPAIYALF